MCREASMMPIRKKLIEGGGIMNKLNDIEKLKGMLYSNWAKLLAEINVPICQADFIAALKNVHKSVSNTDLGRFEKWMSEFGSV